MKRLLISIVAVGLLVFNTMAYAAEGAEQISAGITPDSYLYTADKLFEDLKLMLTFDSEKEASLLLQFANERLAEAKEMTENEKTEFVETAVKDYIETIEKAQEKVLEVVTDENKDAEIKEELTQELTDATEVNEKVEESLDDVVKEELENKTEEVKYSARVVENIEPEVVKTLREKDMGFGQIAQVVLLSNMSGKSIDEVSKLFTDEGKGLGSVAKELGIHPSEIKKKVAAKTSEITDKANKEDTKALTDDSKDQTNEIENKQVEDKVDNHDKKEVVEKVSNKNPIITNKRNNVELKINQKNDNKELDVAGKKEIKESEVTNKSEKETLKEAEKEKKEELKIEEQKKKDELKKEHKENKGKKR